MYNIICEYCSKDFNGRKNQKYCKDECRLEADKERKRTAYRKNHHSNGVKCNHCKKEFIPNENGAKYKYCSDDCYKEYRREYNRIKMRESNPPKPDVTIICEWCGNLHTVSPRTAHQARFCSDSCRDTWWSRQKGHRTLDEWVTIREGLKQEHQARLEEEREERRRVVDCAECGEEFVTYHSKQITCSSECSRIRGNRLKWQRGDTRLNEGNIVDKDISLRVLYKRDEGVCYICGEQCDFDDYSRVGGHFTSGPTYPSTDHIIPIARGGKHAWDNVKLAHHLCNSKKSDMIPDELGIDIEMHNPYALARKVSPRKKAVRQYTREGKLISEYESTAEAGRRLGIPSKTIQNNARGESKTAHGFVFEYV